MGRSPLQSPRAPCWKITSRLHASIVPRETELGLPLPALPVFATGPNSPASCKPPPKSAGSISPAARSHRSSTGPAVQGWSGQEPLPLEHSPEIIKFLLQMNKINNKKEANGAVLKLCTPTACSGQADGGRGGPEPSTAVTSMLPSVTPKAGGSPRAGHPVPEEQTGGGTSTARPCNSIPSALSRSRGSICCQPPQAAALSSLAPARLSAARPQIWDPTGELLGTGGRFLSPASPGDAPACTRARGSCKSHPLLMVTSDRFHSSQMGTGQPGGTAPLIPPRHPQPKPKACPKSRKHGSHSTVHAPGLGKMS